LAKAEKEEETATSDPIPPKTPTEEKSPVKVIVDAAEAATDAIFGDDTADKVIGIAEKGLTAPRASIFNMFRKSPLRELRKSMSPSRTTVDPGMLAR
jgi:hypothetical protein